MPMGHPLLPVSWLGSWALNPGPPKPLVQAWRPRFPGRRSSGRWTRHQRRREMLLPLGSGSCLRMRIRGATTTPTAEPEANPPCAHCCGEAARARRARAPGPGCTPSMVIRRANALASSSHTTQRDEPVHNEFPAMHRRRTCGSPCHHHGTPTRSFPDAHQESPSGGGHMRDRFSRSVVEGSSKYP
jgi:hypothetical protein